MRHQVSAIVALSLLVAVPALAQEAAGEWLVSDRTAQIRVLSCGGALWGVVSWEQTPGGRDSHNPDGAKRDRPTLGIPILLNMAPSDPGKWEGEIYNAENGRTYDGSITLRSANTLHVEGCVMGFLCGGEDWTRTQARSNPVGAAPGGDPATTPPGALCARIGAGRAH